MEVQRAAARKRSSVMVRNVEELGGADAGQLPVPVDTADQGG